MAVPPRRRGRRRGKPEERTSGGLLRTRATTIGVPPTSGGASQSRIIPTRDGTFHAKFVLSGGEGRRAPINELLANKLLGYLGADRPQLALIEIPEVIKAGAPEVSGMNGNCALGMQRLEGAVDLDGVAIEDAARDAPDDELFAQYVVLTWLQNSDHANHNFIAVGKRVVAIDFAATPDDGVWQGGQLGEARLEHGQLRSRIDRVADDVRSDLLNRLRNLSKDGIIEMTRDAPAEWATEQEREHVASELERTKEALLADFG